MDAQIKKHSPLVSPCRLLIGNLPMVFRAGEGDPNIFAQLYIYWFDIDISQLQYDDKHWPNMTQ